jgi:hypothetical protein
MEFSRLQMPPLRQAGVRLSHHDRQLRQWLDDMDRPSRPPLPLVSCAGCRHFTPGKINGTAGLGFCAKFNGWNYPGTQRHCREFEEVIA